MNRTLKIIIGILGIFVGLGFVMPAVAQLRTTGSLPGLGVALLLLGAILTLTGAGAALHGLKRRGA
jgi:hypothetical protein